MYWSVENKNTFYSGFNATFTFSPPRLTTKLQFWPFVVNRRRKKKVEEGSFFFVVHKRWILNRLSENAWRPPAADLNYRVRHMIWSPATRASSTGWILWLIIIVTYMSLSGADYGPGWKDQCSITGADLRGLRCRHLLLFM